MKRFGNFSINDVNSKKDITIFANIKLRTNDELV